MDSVEPSSSTTHASGRSPHRSSGTPITAASRISGWAISSFSSSTDEIHSPPGLDEVLRAVDEADPSALVHRRDVAGAQPAVVGEALAGPRVVVVRRRDPRPAALQLAARLAVTRHWCGRPGLDDPALDAERDAPHAGSQVGLLGLGQVALVGVEAAHRRHRARLGHPPRLQDRQPELLSVRLRQRLRHRRSAARDGPQRGGVPPLEVGQHLHPDRRHAGRNGHPLLDDEVGDRRSRQVGSWHHEVGAAGHAGVGEPPRVGMEHRHDRQDAVGLAGAERVGRHRAHRVQERAAVAVHDALGVAGGAARVAHARRLVLVVDAELDRRGRRQQLLVVEQLVSREVGGDVALPVVHDA